MSRKLVGCVSVLWCDKCRRPQSECLASGGACREVGEPRMWAGEDIAIGQHCDRCMGYHVCTCEQSLGAKAAAPKMAGKPADLKDPDKPSTWNLGGPKRGAFGSGPNDIKIGDRVMIDGSRVGFVTMLGTDPIDSRRTQTVQVRDDGNTVHYWVWRTDVVPLEGPPRFSDLVGALPPGYKLEAQPIEQAYLLIKVPDTGNSWAIPYETVRACHNVQGLMRSSVEHLNPTMTLDEFCGIKPVPAEPTALEAALKVEEYHAERNGD